MDAKPTDRRPRPADFEAALSGACALLRELPRDRDQVDEVRARLADFRRRHPTVRADLLVDRPPASVTVDFDLLLGHPDGGTVAISWRRVDETPWAIHHADHWAANYVVSVNRHHLTVQQALVYLKLTGEAHPDVMREIEDQLLLGEAIEAAPPEVTAEEVEEAGGTFMTARGLLDADARARWLTACGLSAVRFELLMRRRVQIDKLITGLTASHVERHFEAEASAFDRMRIVEAWTTNWDVAGRLAAAAADAGLLAAAASVPGATEAEVRLATRFALDLPASVAGEAPGVVVGPEAVSPFRIRLTQVVARSAARLDAPTRARIREHLLEVWLTERRRTSVIRWHWF